MMNIAALKPIISAPPAVSVIALSVLLSGCGSMGGGHSAKVTGSLAGISTTQRTSAAYIAALQGGVIGREGASAISKADLQRALEAEYRALEAAPGGQPVIWKGSGVTGSVVAAAPYQVGSQNCRQYSHTLTIKGADTVGRGAACRNADGTWTPLS